MIRGRFQRQLSFMNTSTAVIIARVLGLTELDGKPLPVSMVRDFSNVLSDPASDNVPIGDVADVKEDTPTVAVNPQNPKQLVAGMQSGSMWETPASCLAYSSTDGGKTWNAPITMPLMDPVSFCAEPVLAFSPDGTRVYYAYMDVKLVFSDSPPTWTISFDIVESFSDDGGLSWTGPIVALQATPTVIVFSPFSFTPGAYYEKPWISTPRDGTQSSFVYVTATKNDATLDMMGQLSPQRLHVVFTRSDAKGATDSWSVPTILDSTPDITNPPTIVVQGARPAGGQDGDVLVAWYNSNGPGILPGIGHTPPTDPDGYGRNSFIIRTRYSSDHGATFGEIVNAAVDSFEVPKWLGPWGSFFSWWTAMCPDITIAADGSAHVVYAHDPGSSDMDVDPEDGDVRYISSSGPPYVNWSEPETVNDDGLARSQGFASIDVIGSTLYTTFLDTRLSSFVVSNGSYDVFGAYKRIGEMGWHNFRVSDASSASAQVAIGDRFDLAATNEGIYAVWTDRRHLPNYFWRDNNVYGQGFSPIPTIATIAPVAASAGASAFTLSVNGSEFLPNSLVLWNGSERTTTFVSGTQLTASILATDIATGGTAEVMVYTSGGPAAGTSAKASFNISDYSLGFAPGSSAITSGQSASYTVTVSPTGGVFDRTISLSCSGLPNLATCSFSPASLTPNGSAVTSTLMISTIAPKTAMNTFSQSTFFAIWLPLFGVVGLMGGVSRKKCVGLLLLVLALMVLLLAGCGSDSTTKTAAVTQPGTPAGTYTITVTGVAGSVAHTGTVTLIVN